MLVAAAVIGVPTAACARPKEDWDVMSMPAACDSVPLPLEPGEPLGATLPAGVRASPDSGTAVGTVTEAGTGRTMHGAIVAFLALPESDRERRPTRRTATTSTGGFEVRALLPGRYRLRVNRIGQRLHEREVELHAGAVDTFAVQLGAMRCTGF